MGAMTGEEIKRRLVDFARKWSLYDGTERAEAQTFLNELFTCYGNDRQQAGACFDIRYTPSSAFETFPWPQPDDAQRERVAQLSRDVIDLRSTLCREHEIGLTTLYNRVDDGAYAALRDAHRDLDLAVLAAYGWSSALLDDVRLRNRALLDLNSAIRTGDVPYSPF